MPLKCISASKDGLRPMIRSHCYYSTCVFTGVPTCALDFVIHPAEWEEKGEIRTLLNLIPGAFCDDACSS